MPADPRALRSANRTYRQPLLIIGSSRSLRRLTRNRFRDALLVLGGVVAGVVAATEVISRLIP